MFPEANIGEDTEVIVTSQDYLLKVSQVVASTDRATLNSYIIWTLVKEYIPYLSSQFTSTVNVFNKELLGIQEPLPRWEFCVNLVKKFMGFAVDVMLDRRQPVINNTVQELEDIFSNMKHVVTDRLSKFSTVPNLEQHLSRKVKNLKLQIGLPEEVTSEAYLRNYYNKLMILKANLFESYRNGIVFLKKIDEHKLIKKDHGLYYQIAGATVSKSVKYDPNTNTVIIPRTMLIEPNFNVNYPK